jgi:hypothetical protein
MCFAECLGETFGVHLLPSVVVCLEPSTNFDYFFSLLPSNFFFSSPIVVRMIWWVQSALLSVGRCGIENGIHFSLDKTKGRQTCKTCVGSIQADCCMVLVFSAQHTTPIWPQGTKIRKSVYMQSQPMKSRGSFFSLVRNQQHNQSRNHVVQHIRFPWVLSSIWWGHAL